MSVIMVVFNWKWFFCQRPDYSWTERVENGNSISYYWNEVIEDWIQSSKQVVEIDFD